MPGEAVAGKTMGALAAPFAQDGPKIIKFLVQHGLLGTADPLPQRHIMAGTAASTMRSDPQTYTS